MEAIVPMTDRTSRGVFLGGMSRMSAIFAKIRRLPPGALPGRIRPVPRVNRLAADLDVPLDECAGSHLRQQRQILFGVRVAWPFSGSLASQPPEPAGTQGRETVAGPREFCCKSADSWGAEHAVFRAMRQ
jgi:hypothetical protein